MSIKLSQSEKDLMNSLYRDCSLEPTDIYKDKRGFKLITRTGIEKIQSVKKIKVRFEHVKIEPEFCVIKAIGNMDGEIQETYGSASKQTSMNKHYPEMAEKRALARVVLKLTKGYQHGLMSEDEMGEEKSPTEKLKPKKGDREWTSVIVPYINKNKKSQTFDQVFKQLLKEYTILPNLKKSIKDEYDK